MASPARLPLALTLACAALPALAGRPLSTDDAATAPPATCQVEGWLERAGPDRARVWSPACGLVAGLELAAESARPRPLNPVDVTAGAALKWVPEAWQVDTPGGTVQFGLRLGTGYDHGRDGEWQRTRSSALALATWTPHADWTLHANLGPLREHVSRQTATLARLAVAWTPRADTVLFAEVQANDRRDLLGGAVRTVGGRVWLLPDRFGLDITRAREATPSVPVRWTAGFGWYGIGF